MNRAATPESFEVIIESIERGGPHVQAAFVREMNAAIERGEFTDDGQRLSMTDFGYTVDELDTLGYAADGTEAT